MVELTAESIGVCSDCTGEETILGSAGDTDGEGIFVETLSDKPELATAKRDGADADIVTE